MTAPRRPISLTASNNAALAMDVAADLVQATEMVDPKQNMDFQSATSTEQIRTAIRTIEAEFTTPDGIVITADDVSDAGSALETLKRVCDRIETKLAGYSAKHHEKPRSH